MAALVQHVRNPFFREIDRRGVERHVCSLDATSRPIDAGDGVSWGAVVHEISPKGVGITLCYPFKPGTFLAVDLPCSNGMVRTMMVRVVHVQDQNDGNWRLGCESLKPLNECDMEDFAPADSPEPK